MAHALHSVVQGTSLVAVATLKRGNHFGSAENAVLSGASVSRPDLAVIWHYVVVGAVDVEVVHRLGCLDLRLGAAHSRRHRGNTREGIAERRQVDRETATIGETNGVNAFGVDVEVFAGLGDDVVDTRLVLLNRVQRVRRRSCLLYTSPSPRD